MHGHQHAHNAHCFMAAVGSIRRKATVLGEVQGGNSKASTLYMACCGVWLTHESAEEPVSLGRTPAALFDELLARLHCVDDPQSHQGLAQGLGVFGAMATCQRIDRLQIREAVKVVHLQTHHHTQRTGIA